MISVSGFLLVLAHSGCAGQNPESHKMVVYVCVLACVHVLCRTILVCIVPYCV